MIDGLLIALLLAAWGSQAVVPWRLRRAEAGRRRAWALAAAPLALAGALAALALARLHPDAALAARLAPFPAAPPGRLLAVLFPALLAADLLLLAGWDRLEDLGWPLAAALGAGHLGVAAGSLERLRIGEGPAGAAWSLPVAAACLTLLGLAAGELLAPGRPLGAALAALAVPSYLVALPVDLREPVLRQGLGWTALAAAVLFAAARFLPARLRRPSLAAGVLLAGLLLGQLARASEDLAHRPLPPLESLPVR